MSIKPALTAEEWASDTPIDDNTQTIVGGRLYFAGRLIHDMDRHALAALCLHGQTYGFTREDVELLRESDRIHQVNSPPEERGPYADLADRIEALLPPETQQ